MSGCMVTVEDVLMGLLCPTEVPPEGVSGPGNKSRRISGANCSFPQELWLMIKVWRSEI